MPDLDGFGVIENVESIVPPGGPAPVYIFVTLTMRHASRWHSQVHAVWGLSLETVYKDDIAKARVHDRQVLEQSAERKSRSRTTAPIASVSPPVGTLCVRTRRRIFFVPRFFFPHVFVDRATGN